MFKLKTEKITIDYDGVIADTNSQKSEWISDNLGYNVPPYFCDRTNCVRYIGKSRYEELSKIIYDREYSLSAEPISGSIKIIKKLSTKYSLFIISARSDEKLIWAKEWLRMKGINTFFNSIMSR